MKNIKATDLSRAKGLGSAKSGYHHWIMQRFSAILLVALTFWLVFFILQLKGKNLEEILELAARPYYGIPVVLFICSALYHSTLGMQVIVEDYVNCTCRRNFLIIFLRLLSIITAGTFIYVFLFFEFLFVKFI